MKVIILKSKPKDAHFSKFRLIKFSKQMTIPRGNEISPNRENFEQFLNDLTLVSAIAPKLSELEILNKINLPQCNGIDHIRFS